ncbi:MAG TPA: hypothetical protein VK929_06940 [Longimicrobiales bacterium]|nr:hypothetical protein [Longimicrobiales bacterium]
MEALIPITFFMSVAAVLILRPISKKVGGLLEAMTRERTTVRGDEAATARMIGLMEHMSRRMDMMEERLDFTERLVASPPRRRVRGRAPAGTLPRS